MTDALLRLDHVQLRRGSRAVLAGVSFAVAPGEIVAILGQSGSGKTTVLRAIAALEPFHSGTIAIDRITLTGGRAVDVRTRREEIQRREGTITQREEALERRAAELERFGAELDSRAESLSSVRVELEHVLVAEDGAPLAAADEDAAWDGLDAADRLPAVAVVELAAAGVVRR